MDSATPAISVASQAGDCPHTTHTHAAEPETGRAVSVPGIDSLQGEALDRAVALLMEPLPPAITAREARVNDPTFVWVSCHDYYSPEGWWVAEIGTDHGPQSADDDPVRWRPRWEVEAEPHIALAIAERFRISLVIFEDGFYAIAPDDIEHDTGNTAHPFLVLIGGKRVLAETAELAIARCALLVQAGGAR